MSITRAITRTITRVATRSILDGPAPGGVAATHVLTPGDTANIYGYYSNGAWGAVSPGTLSGENIYSLFMYSTGATANKMQLYLGGSTTQLAGVTVVACTFPDEGTEMLMTWDGNSYESIPTYPAVSTYLQANVGNPLSVSLIPQ